MSTSIKMTVKEINCKLRFDDNSVMLPAVSGRMKDLQLGDYVRIKNLRGKKVDFTYMIHQLEYMKNQINFKATLLFMKSNNKVV